MKDWWLGGGKSGMVVNFIAFQVDKTSLVIKLLSRSFILSKQNVVFITYDVLIGSSSSTRTKFEVL